jgi:hypothetical protein
MQYRIALLICCCLKLIPSFSQTFDEVCEQAKKEDKIVMLVVETDKCSQCNEVGRIGLSDPTAKRMIDANAKLLFVSKIPEPLSNPNLFFSFQDKFFGVIYLDGDKNILSLYSGSSTSHKIYIDKLEEAIKEKKSKSPGIAKLSNEYYGNKNNFKIAYGLIEKMLEMGLEPQQGIIDDLTQAAPADSINSVTFLQFIYKAAPEVGSYSERYGQKNYDNSQMAWWRMSLNTRISINARIHQKSLKKAIINKDRNYLYQVSYMISNAFRPSGAHAMQVAQQATVLEYYKGTNDTALYLTYAATHFDNFFMTISVDSILKIDSINKEKLIKSFANKNKQGLSVAEEKSFILQTLGMKYASALNDGAWTTYTFTKEKNYLSNALRWAKRANEFFETPEIMDTYARILYKTNNKSLAIEWENRAIDLMKRRNFSAAEYEKVLEAMKNGSDKIDEY